MGKFLLDIQQDYDERQRDKQYGGDGYPTKYHYLAENIFEFTTYDEDVDMLWAMQMVDVCEAIISHNTHKYQKESNDNYLTYLTMVNMPFLVDKLDWGTSIRGAWFDERHSFEVTALGIVVSSSDTKEFIADLIAFARG